ncbi:hypothetical protein QQ045_000523 [Rhodiola kirilowii]
MFHRETNPYFIQPHDGDNQAPVTAPHGQGSSHIPPRKDQHPRFLVPTQEHDHNDQHPQNQGHDPQHTLPPQPQNIRRPQGQHSFQIPLQQGKQQKKAKDKKGEHSRKKQPQHLPLPHIYVPHDIRHQEPPHDDIRHQDQSQHDIIKHKEAPHRAPRHQTHHGLRVPHPHKTKPVTWFVAVFCAVLWLIIFLGGLIVVLIYLIYRPHSPKYELSEVALNAAYLDTGSSLLNADVRLLANFTNINKKVKVDFRDMVINLYYGRILIATQYIKPFTETRKEHVLIDIHLVSSQVQLPLQESQRLKRQLDNNRVALQVQGLFRTRYSMGSLFKYTYTLHSNCRVLVSGPPNGVLVAKNCRTKR